MANYATQVNLGAGLIDLFPCNDELVFQWQKDEEYGFYRHVLNTRLNIHKDDFHQFWEVENSCDRCDRIPIEVKLSCSDDVFWIGYLNLNVGDWNKDRCELNIRVEPIDQYTCLYDNWENEKNILTGDRITVQPFIGVIQTVVCNDVHVATNGVSTGWQISDENTYPYADNCINAGEGWVAYKSQFTDTDEIVTNELHNTLDGANVITHYAREFYAGGTAPSGNGWIVVVGGFARPVPRILSIGGINYDDAAQTLSLEWQIAGFNANGEFDPIDNGRKLEDVFNKLLEDCPYTIVSDFYNINPDSTALNNTAYQYALDHFANLLIFQKSDITNAYASQNASIANVDFKTLISDLQKLHNIQFRIDSNNVLRIEHVSYWSESNGIDLVADYGDCIKGLYSYTYQNTIFPQFEKWELPEPASTFFIGNPIMYLSCFEVGQTESYIINQLNTDLPYFLDNDGAGVDGLFILETVEFNGEFSIIESNHGQSFTNLHPALWVWNRKQYTGTVNDVVTTFETAIRTKEQDLIQIPICCDVMTFNPSDLLTTQMGIGELKQGEYSTRTQVLSLSILHDQNQC